MNPRMLCVYRISHCSEKFVRRTKGPREKYFYVNY